jgi:signal transduction histidine kinase
MVTIVLVAILIPSALITLLGLFAVYRAEPMVREQLAYPMAQVLDRLAERLTREWEYRFQELGRWTAAEGWLERGPAGSSPRVSEVLLYAGGAFHRPDPREPPLELEASPADPVLARARELELREHDHGRALALYRSAAAEGPPERAAEALFGAARCQRELGQWQEAVRTLRRLVDRFGESVDATGAARGLPALLSMVEISRDNGDFPGEQLAVRELLGELRRARERLDGDQQAFYLSRLKRYPEAADLFTRSEAAGGEGAADPRPGSAPLLSGPAAPAGPRAKPPAAGSPVGPGAKRDELAERLRPHAEERGVLDAPGYHRVTLPDGTLAVLAFFRAPGETLSYLRLDPAAYLRDVSLFCRELNLSPRALRFTDQEGRAAAAAGEPASPPPADMSPLATRALPRPFSHLSVHYYPAPGEVTEELRRLETSRVALFTWSIVVLVLMIVLGVSVTLRTVLREMQVTKLKTDFVSFVTHELKTPLTAIRMFTETLLLERVGSEEERRRCLELIDLEAARLSRLIEQVLEFSKIQRRQKAFHFTSGDMAEVIEEAVRIFQDHNREAGCEIEVNKAQHAISRIKMDRAAMVELLLNLFSNALKYSRDSKKIVVNVRESINDITVEVIDRGIGIPKREQRKIFEKFYRAQDYLTREVEGTGLGLTFARYIAKVHGGDIKVSSVVNQGSTFTLELRKNQVLAE